MVEKSRADFASTTSRTQAVLDGMTGGRTYPVVHLVPVPIDNSPNTFRLFMEVRGKNPLFDVSLSVRKLPISSVFNLTDFLTTGGDLRPVLTASSLSPTISQIIPMKITPSLDETTDYFINTTAGNGTFIEELHIRRLGNGDLIKRGRDLLSPWEQSYEIRKNGRLIKKQRWLKCLLAGAASVGQ